MSSDTPIILYHYDASPYARKIRWYLELRGIPYKQCVGLVSSHMNTTIATVW